MKATLCFVPPGGGEQDFMLELELPGVPRVGDYIIIETEPDSSGNHCQGFIVRRNCWRIKDGQLRRLVVEAKFAKTSWATDDHEASLKKYSSRGHEPQTMDQSGY